MCAVKRIQTYKGDTVSYFKKKKNYQCTMWWRQIIFFKGKDRVFGKAHKQLNMKTYLTIDEAISYFHDHLMDIEGIYNSVRVIVEYQDGGVAYYTPHCIEGVPQKDNGYVKWQVDEFFDTSEPVDGKYDVLETAGGGDHTCRVYKFWNQAHRNRCDEYIGRTLVLDAASHILPANEEAEDATYQELLYGYSGMECDIP